MKKLELPPTIRTLSLDDFSNNTELEAAISKAATANIIEGYTIQTDIASEPLFNFFAEINIDNSRLWDLLESLLSLLPEEISFIFGHIDAEPEFSEYDYKDNILKHIQPYRTELSQDGFLEFGFIFQDEKMLTEIFLKRPKYIQFWGTSLKPFLDIMNKFSISEIEDLNFVDEYPMVTESLSHLSPEYTDTPQILSHFKDIFINHDK